MSEEKAATESGTPYRPNVARRHKVLVINVKFHTLTLTHTLTQTLTHMSLAVNALSVLCCVRPAPKLATKNSENRSQRPGVRPSLLLLPTPPVPSA